MKDGDVMNKKLIISLSVGLTSLLIVGISVLATIDMVKNDMSWANDIPVQTGTFIGSDIKEANNKEHVYASFKLDVELISVDDYIQSNDVNTVVYYREHDNRFAAEYYSMKFYVESANVPMYERLDINNLVYAKEYREAYFVGMIGRSDFKIHVNKEGMYKITFDDYSSLIKLQTEA